MPKEYSTNELIDCFNALKKIDVSKMKASGISIYMEYLDGSDIGSMYFQGENLNKLIPVLLEDVKDTLKFRKLQLQSEIRDITKLMEGEGCA